MASWSRYMSSCLWCSDSHEAEFPEGHFRGGCGDLDAADSLFGQYVVWGHGASVVSGESVSIQPVSPWWATLTGLALSCSMLKRPWRHL